MSNVLVIDASARKNGSLSRYLTRAFVEQWKKRNPDATFTHRDVGMDKIPHVTEQWIAGAYSLPESRSEADMEALKLSDELVSEVKKADVIVLGTPMYNWSVPSALKAYIDQILRVGETVLVLKDDERNPYRGLLQNKSVYMIMVRGNNGYEPGNFYHHMDFQTEYLKTVFRIMGLDDVKDFAVNGATLKYEREPWEVTAERLLTHFNLNGDAS